MRYLMSIVVPTKNSEDVLGPTLESIKAQTYTNYELIVVDGHSTDRTREIAESHGAVYITSSENLPAARNSGFAKAKGDIFLSIDSDMILDNNLLEEVSEKMEGHGALVLSEVGYGDDFMSRCKDLEKRCYIGDEVMEASRAVRREAFEAVGGYDGNLVFGEDWDISLRVKSKYSIGRINARIHHNTSHLSFWGNLRKAYKYGYTLPRYLAKGHDQAKEWLDVRKIFFIRHFDKLRRESILAIGLFFIKGTEYAAGILGLTAAKLESWNGKSSG